MKRLLQRSQSNATSSSSAYIRQNSGATASPRTARHPRSSRPSPARKGFQGFQARQMDSKFRFNVVLIRASVSADPVLFNVSVK